MNGHDILFKTEDAVFSHRVSGVLIRDGKILRQHPVGSPDYAFPGGYVRCGETSENAIERELKEELGADVRTVRLLWIGENFFPGGEKSCHQICLYYLVGLCDETQLPLDGSFRVKDELDEGLCDLEFCWIRLSALKDMELYPDNVKEELMDLSDAIEHFVFTEGQ